MEIQNRIKLTFHYSAIKPNLEDLGGKLETVLTFHYSAINPNNVQVGGRDLAMY